MGIGPISWNCRDDLLNAAGWMRPSKRLAVPWPSACDLAAHGIKTGKDDRAGHRQESTVTPVAADTNVAAFENFSHGRGLSFPPSI